MVPRHSGIVWVVLPQPAPDSQALHPDSDSTILLQAGGLCHFPNPQPNPLPFGSCLPVPIPYYLILDSTTTNGGGLLKKTDSFPLPAPITPTVTCHHAISYRHFTLEKDLFEQDRQVSVVYCDRHGGLVVVITTPVIADYLTCQSPNLPHLPA